ncbi:carboxypeptidase-like regulatory domain-containing protein [Paenibacillus sp. RC67]|uniref:carboxypeptidase-like regulatory domain-containing protein n=1 Tax=Paenibacillus sp. RC67 TaxID=3039392 RepID=UPI0024ACCAA8|nr:carboxypeptidase-like regulatory domain-containing protein [Paenibacillus sp. RC67]
MIRIKYKTLALSILLLLVSALVVFVELPQKLLDWKKYDVILDYFPRSNQVPQALYWAAEEAVPNPTDNRIYIFHRSSSYSSSGNASQQQLAYAKEKLEKLLEEYPRYELSGQARWKLANIYFAQKEYERAESLFRSIADNGKGDSQSKEAADYAKLLASWNGVKEGSGLSLTGKVLIGGRPAADTVVVLHRKTDNGWMSPPFGHYPMTMTDSEGTFRFYDVSPDEYDVGVGVEAEAVSGYYLSDQGTDTVNIQTGGTAHYDLRFVPQVKVSQPTNKEMLTSGKLQFSWEPYPGAVSYKLSLTALEPGQNGSTRGTSSIELEEVWTEPKAEYDIETLRTYPRGLGKSYTSTELWLSSPGILGVVYPGGHFIWSVDAFNAQGERISSSRGYYTSLNAEVPFFSVSDKGQLSGDKLVLQGDYQGAIKAYEAEGDNPYALRALAIMMLNGIDREDKGDKAKALGYLQRISNPAPFDLELIKSIGITQ